MKIINVLVVSFLMLTFLACKQEDKKNDETTNVVQKQAVNPNVFSITLNAIVKKDDSFQVYYKENEQDSFDEKNSLYVTFKGSEQPQDIIFNLPENEFPKYFRLDYGINKEQSPIEIKFFKLSYLGKTVEAKGPLFFNYFIVNEETMSVNQEKAILSPFISKDGNYDPMSYTGEGLYKHIQEILLKE